MADSPSPVRVKWKITTYGKAREAPSFKDEWPDAELDDSGVGNDSFSSIQDSSSFNYDEDNVKMDDTFTRFLKRRDIDEELADLDKDFDELEDDKSSKYRKPTRLEEEIPYRSLIPSVAEEVSDALKSLPGLSRSSKTKPKSKSRSKANARTLSEIRESHNLKPPTEKELRETQSARQRMLAEKSTSIPRCDDTGRQRRFTMANFWESKRLKLTPDEIVMEPALSQIEAYPENGPVSIKKRDPHLHFSSTTELPNADVNQSDKDDQDLPATTSALSMMHDATKADHVPHLSHDEHQVDIKQKIAFSAPAGSRNDDRDSDDDLEVLPPEPPRRNIPQPVSTSLPAAKIHKGKVFLSREELNNLMLAAATRQAGADLAARQAHYSAKGGVLKKSDRISDAERKLIMAELAERGVDVARERKEMLDKQAIMMEDEEDEDTEDQDYVPDTLSQEEEADGGAEADAERKDEHILGDDDCNGLEDADTSGNDSDTENPVHHAQKSRHSRLGVIDSDTEADDNDTDKENDTSRMYDQGEDKENKHHTLTQTLSFASRLTLSSSNRPRPLETRQVEVQGGELEPSFEELFECGSPAGGFSQFSDDEAQPSTPKKIAAMDLALTQDIAIQRPDIAISDDVRRKAEAIFEKEQEYVLEEAAAIPAHEMGSNNTLYVKEDGMLTQTRPDVENPEIYEMMTPSQATATAPPSQYETSSPTFSQRPRPALALLSSLDDDDLDAPYSTSRADLSRLRRHNESAPSGFLNPSASAFSLLGKLRSPKEKKKLGKSEFVHREAEESDEDDHFAWGPSRSKDDEDEDDGDGDDENKNVEGLVDDQAMGVDELAEEAVLEKVKEHQEADGKVIEKQVLDVVQGKTRMKRRGGFNLDSDSDGDSDDEHRVIRSKKRKINADSIDSLAADEATLPAYKSYMAALQPDEDLDYLRSDGMDVEEETLPEPRHFLNDDDEDEEPVLTRQQAIQLAIENRRAGLDAPLINPDDVSWIREDTEDTSDVLVRASIRPKPIIIRHSKFSASDIDLESQASFVESESTRARNAAWLRENNRTRNMGNARSVRGAAITGPTKASKFIGSVQKKSDSRLDHARPRKPLIKEASYLAPLGSRSDRFA